jgi:HEAT repeat protein
MFSRFGPTAGFRTLALVGLLLLACACGGGRDKLLALLQSARPEERALAVEKLAAQGKSEDLILFTQAAKDPAAVVRGAAIAALAKSQDTRVVDLLGELLGDPDEGVQARAAMALAEIRSDKAKAYLTVQFGRRSRATRQAIVAALKSANVPGAMAGVIAAESKHLWERNLQALNEGALPERVGAAEELGKSGRAEAVSRLLPLLKESQVVLAAAAVRGLGNAGDKRAAAPIAELLAENYPELREAACESLSRLQEPAALPRLREVALERSAASRMAVTAMISLPPSTAIDAALCEVATSGGDEAMEAGRALRERQGCPVEPLLEKLKDPAQARAVLRAAQGLGPKAHDLLPKILPLLASTDDGLVREALAAVGEIGDPTAAEPVLKVYDEALKQLASLRSDWIPGPLPQKFAPLFGPDGPEGISGDVEGMELKRKQGELFRKVEALDRERARAQGKTLLQAQPPAEVIDDATEPDLARVAAAVRTLGRLEAPGALEKVLPHISESSRALRLAACFALPRLGPKGVEATRAAIADADREIQAEAATALATTQSGREVLLAAAPTLAGEKLRLLEPLLQYSLPVSAVQPLLTVLKEGGGDAALAARLLGRIGDEAAVPELLKALEEPHGVARTEALVALGRIGAASGAAAVGRELYHDNPEIRAAAAGALGLIARSSRSPIEPGSAEALDALKGDYYRKVREEAEAALAKSGPNPGAAEPKR